MGYNIVSIDDPQPASTFPIRHLQIKTRSDFFFGISCHLLLSFFCARSNNPYFTLASLDFYDFDFHVDATHNNMYKNVDVDIYE